MSVLITGINGLVGVHTAKFLLEEGFDVVGYDNNQSGELAFFPEIADRTTYVWGDISQLPHLLETVEKYGVKHIIHLAGLRNEVLFKQMPTELFRVNLQGMQNILELARMEKIERVIFASSAAVYGKMDDPGKPIPEDASQDPKGIYANCKAMCESLCRSYRNVYGVQAFALRPSRVYGRMANLDTLEFGNPLSSFIYKAIRGEAIDDPSGADFGGDFTYAPDTAYGFYRAVVAPTPEDWVFNISSGVFYRLSEVAEILGELFPNAAISVGPGMDPYVSQAPIRGPLDITRAEKQLGFKVQRDLRGSMVHFIEMIQRIKKHEAE